MKAACKKIGQTVNKWIDFLDKSHLEWLGILVLGILIAPILYLGKNCVFDFYDQLDETLLSYVFTARYPGARVYEQMMNGLPAEGLKPSAVLFVPLYYFLSEFNAFIVQYIIVLTSAFFGMYACVKKIGKSSIVAFLSATAFAMIPFRPIYGLSAMGIPLLLFCVLTLEDVWGNQAENLSRGEKNRKIILSFVGLLYFGLTTNLVLSGYVVLMILAAFWGWRLLRGRGSDKALLVTGIFLTLVYLVVNLDLLVQLFTSAQFVSHREEYVIVGADFWQSLKAVFQNGFLHAPTFHKYMWIPIGLAVIILCIFRKKEGAKKYLKTMGTVALWIFLCMLLYAALGGKTVAAIRNKIGGMLKSFQFDRFYWVLPAAWYLLFGLALVAIFACVKKKSAILALICVAVLYFPTILLIGKNSTFWYNVNQARTGTGYVTWNHIFAEDLMSDIEETIGRDMSEYRVASLGMCPVVSLMHGFYTIDGYSNNYPLSYKHEFREIIAGELERNADTKVYFDTWGSRCYLFYSQWGTYHLLPKWANARVEDIDLNFDKMREMGCEYIFSAGEIVCAEEKGLTLVDVFENATSYWRIWVYRL